MNKRRHADEDEQLRGNATGVYHQNKITSYFLMESKEKPNEKKALSKAVPLITLSSEEEEEQEESQPRKKYSLRRRRETKLRKPSSTTKTVEIIDSDTETLSGATTTDEEMENSNEKQQRQEVQENVIDSQEVVSPSKKKRFNRILIADTDEESQDDSTRRDRDTDQEMLEIEDDEEYSTNDERSNSPTDERGPNDSDYTSDGFVCSTESSDQIDTDELERFNDFREPDPFYLYDYSGRNTRSNRKLAALEDIQEVSIHKINLNHYKFDRMPIEQVIHHIVEIYNDSGVEKKNKFIKTKVHDRFQPTVKDVDEQHFDGDDFEIEVYFQKVPKKVSLLNSYGIKEKAITIHSLVFHYRANELFAITTNQAWNVVQWCCDFEFPGIIAARILSKDGELESTNKGLVGTELTRKTTHKQQKKTNPYNILTFCTRFTAELRDNASILRLSCFQKKNLSSESGEDSDEDEREKVYSKVKGIKVTVSLGNIRILKRFSTSDILSILSVLSEISNGKRTDNLDGKNEENSTAHKKYLTAVHTEVAKELNVCLSKIIHDAIANDNDMAELDNYQFCHKHSTDFFNGHDFKLYHNGDLIKDFESETPTIKQIVIELRSCLGDISRDTSDEGFYQLLNKVKISYNFGANGKVKKQEKFINFIDGLMYHSRDNSVFWHVNAMWCHVQDGYLYLVHQQFKNVLNTFLLVDKNDPGYLKYSWPVEARQQRERHLNPEARLTKYLKQYSNLGDTWTCQNTGHDIVDMIKIGKDTETGKKFFFVYYFLPTPNYKTNIKCSHVAESIMQIGKANKRMMGKTQGRNDEVAGSEDVKKQLNSIYRKVIKRPQFKAICPDFETFLKLITEAKFILAIGRESGNQSYGNEIPSLEREQVMATKITTNDIADIFENIVEVNLANDMRMLKIIARTTLNQPFQKDMCPKLAESIHNLLKQKEFIEAEGDSVKGKLFSQSKKSFDLTSNRRVDEYLCEKIICKFQPRVCSVLSKLGFIDMREEISKLTITSFNIIEIPCGSP